MCFYTSEASRYQAIRLQILLRRRDTPLRTKSIAHGRSRIVCRGATQWLDLWQTQPRPAPLPPRRGSHAHHDVLRRAFLRIEARLVFAIILKPILAECFRPQLNLSLHMWEGVHPFQAVCGRVPPTMVKVEPMSETQLDDTSGEAPGASRHIHHMREAAVPQMPEATASWKMGRKYKYRVGQKTLELQSGDRVGVFRPPSTRDDSGVKSAAGKESFCRPAPRAFANQERSWLALPLVSSTILRRAR